MLCTLDLEKIVFNAGQVNLLEEVFPWGFNGVFQGNASEWYSTGVSPKIKKTTSNWLHLLHSLFYCYYDCTITSTRYVLVLLSDLILYQMSVTASLSLLYYYHSTRMTTLRLIKVLNIGYDKNKIVIVSKRLWSYHIIIIV